MVSSKGSALFKKYRIKHLLGRGGFAEVYLAEHLHLRALRALKILRRGRGVSAVQLREASERFRREAQLGATFADEPRIVRVYDFEVDVEAGLAALVMEYMPGKSLRDRLIEARKRGEQGLPVDFVVHTARDVAQGLAALHRRGYVHRDIKPSNILYTVDGRAKVADLGLVQAPNDASHRPTLESLAAPHPGTPGYKSPEQVHSLDTLSSASDIYSLGVVLFEALTLKRYGKDVRPGTRVSRFRSDVPKWLDRLIAAMLAEAPEKRPWDGEELAKRLETVLSRENGGKWSRKPLVAADKQTQKQQVERTPQAESRGKTTGWRQVLFAVGSVGMLALLLFLGMSAGWRSQRQWFVAITGARATMTTTVTLPPETSAVLPKTTAVAYTEGTPTLRPSLTASAATKPSPTSASTPSPAPVLTPIPSQDLSGALPTNLAMITSENVSHVATVARYYGRGWVTDVAFSPDGKTLAVATAVGIYLYDLATGVGKLFWEGNSVVNSVAFSPDGKLLASGLEDHTARLWEVSSGKQIMVLKGHKESVLSVAFVPGGELLVSTSYKEARIWRLSSGQLKNSIPLWYVGRSALSPDGRFLAAGSNDGAVRLWRVSDGHLLRIVDHSWFSSSVSFSPDSQLLASWTWDRPAELGRLSLWRLSDGVLLHVFPFEGYGCRAAFSPDGRLLAAGYDKEVYVWKVSNGNLLAVLKGHTRNVTDVTFSPDGKLLASASADGTIRLWGIMP